MKTPIMAAALALAASSAHAQQIAPPPNFDSYVAEVMRTFDVPGLTIAIVKDGQTVVARGYGVKELGKADRVDANTLFGIASNTKVVTATALGMLVEQGKLDWNKPVIDYLPWFRLSDPYVTSQITVKDLLVHNSGLGLGAGDLLWWPPSTYNRRQIAERLRHIPLVTSFRSAYAYDNVLYLIAGLLIEEASGLSYEDFIERNILDRIGAQNAEPGHSAVAAGGNVSSTHARVEGAVRVIKPFASDNTNPAGGIMAGATDMAKWMTVMLDSGRIRASNERLFTARTARILWTGVTPLNVGTPAPELAPQQATFALYALGLNVRDYRGRKMLIHSGGLPGFISRVIMIPDLKLGVAVLTNHESVAMDPIAFRVLDHYMGAQHDWLAGYRKIVAANDSAQAAELKQGAASRDSLSKPSLALTKYAGTYRDPWYGDVVITETAGKLGIRFAHTPSLVGDLVHWQHDTFLARWHDRELRADAFVTFALNPDATIREVSIVPESSAVDFSFDFQDLKLVPVR